MSPHCKDKMRCYPHGECPLKDKCLWRGVPHRDEACSDVEKFDNSYKCGVLNCGDGKCIHKLTKERCPYCGMRLVEVTTSGVKFCSNHESICDYDRFKDDPIVKLCGNIGIECKPGYLGPCNCAEGDDTHHFHINAEKMK